MYIWSLLWIYGAEKGQKSRLRSHSYDAFIFVIKLFHNTKKIGQPTAADHRGSIFAGFPKNAGGENAFGNV